MFDEMIDSIREESIKMLLRIEIREAGQAPRREQVTHATNAGLRGPAAANGQAAAPQSGASAHTPVRVQKIGRNDPCPCGSGLKWKKCTCAQYHPDLAQNQNPEQN